MERIMKKPELAEELAARTGFYKKNMREVVEALADIVLDSYKLLVLEKMNIVNYILLPVF